MLLRSIPGQEIILGRIGGLASHARINSSSILNNVIDSKTPKPKNSPPLKNHALVPFSASRWIRARDVQYLFMIRAFRFAIPTVIITGTTPRGQFSMIHPVRHQLPLKPQPPVLRIPEVQSLHPCQKPRGQQHLLMADHTAKKAVLDRTSVADYLLHWRSGGKRYGDSVFTIFTADFYLRVVQIFRSMFT